MSGPIIVMAAIVMALSLPMQPNPVQPKPTPAQPGPPLKPGIVDVEIIIGTLEAHQKGCKSGVFGPTTVLVVGINPHHCVKNAKGPELIGHDDKHPDFGQSMVRAATGDRIRWFSKTNRFFVASVTPHDPVLKAAPASPFIEPKLPTTFVNEYLSPPIRDEPGNVVQRYKVTFEIEKIGRVDPDVVCSM
jgi:hypothetical protein